MAFQKATKKQARLRMALVGPSGSGKTFSALSIASGLGERIALIDTERASASKYADEFTFDTLELESFHPQKFIDAIKEAERAGYDVLIIDSLSHAWMGKDGALEQVDNAAKRSKAGNSFAAWREVTPLHNSLVDAILRSRLHIIATMRVKTEWVLEKDKEGKTSPKKVGLAPVQRDSVEYEFDVVGDLDEATLVITKTRCRALHEGVFKRPDAELGKTLRGWLTDGVEPAVDARQERSRALRESLRERFPSVMASWDEGATPYQLAMQLGAQIGLDERAVGQRLRDLGRTSSATVTVDDVLAIAAQHAEGTPTVAASQ